MDKEKAEAGEVEEEGVGVVEGEVKEYMDLAQEHKVFIRFSFLNFSMLNFILGYKASGDIPSMPMGGG